MSISTKKIRAVLRHSAANQKLTISVASLIVQIHLIHVASQFTIESGGPIVLIFTCVVVLIFNSWLVSQFDSISKT